MVRRSLPLLLLMVALSITVFAGVIREETLNATSDGYNITIRWTSDNETGVVKYILERRSGTSGNFMPIVELQPRGNNSSYQFVDENAFRMVASLYQYRLRVDFSGGSAPMYFGPIAVVHKTSDVRATWGSIKAMFR